MKIHANSIKKDDIMAFVYWVKVQPQTETWNVTSGGKRNILCVKNIDDGMEFEVRGTDLIEKGYSANQFEEETKVTKTKTAEILVSSHNRPLTVCFEKLNGEERVLRGRLITPEPLLGRSMVEDLDGDGTNRMRLVDHRTIKYLIIDGVKHSVK